MHGNAIKLWKKELTLNARQFCVEITGVAISPSFSLTQYEEGSWGGESGLSNIYWKTLAELFQYGEYFFPPGMP